jgi:hypothetical protein
VFSLQHKQASVMKLACIQAVTSITAVSREVSQCLHSRAQRNSKLYALYLHLFSPFVLTENVLHRGSGMGGNYAEVDVTILCTPHKS